jgi:hypothetical protein
MRLKELSDLNQLTVRIFYDFKIFIKDKLFLYFKPMKDRVQPGKEVAKLNSIQSAITRKFDLAITQAMDVIHYVKTKKSLDVIFLGNTRYNEEVEALITPYLNVFNDDDYAFMALFVKYVCSTSSRIIETNEEISNVFNNYGNTELVKSTLMKRMQKREDKKRRLKTAEEDINDDFNSDSDNEDQGLVFSRLKKKPKYNCIEEKSSFYHAPNLVSYNIIYMFI